MKKISFLMLVALSVSVISCKNATETNPATDENGIVENEKILEEATTPEAVVGDQFDINTIAVSDADLGDFPYFKLPDGYAYSDPDHARSKDYKGLTTDYDKEYFLDHGVYIPQEGKTFKAHIRLDENAQDKTYSPLELQKSFDDLIANLGGVKINNGTGYKSGENERVNELDPQAQSMGYKSSSMYFENIHTYVIRKPEYNVWVQHNTNQENGYITVLQTKPFENKMTILKADQIQKDLNEKGKAVLHINFDTDKATLKADGKDAVSEISKALQSDNSLKININGYTDNTGDDFHNITLSKNRAETVKNAIIASGIDGNRLTSDGFGSKNPIADNASEDGKAQNRRVELVKK